MMISVAGFIPCFQADDCSTEGAGQHQNKDEEGACSPFMTCGNCSGFTDTASNFDLAFIPGILQIHHPGNFSFIFSNYKASLLQPPGTGLS